MSLLYNNDASLSMFKYKKLLRIIDSSQDNCFSKKWYFDEIFVYGEREENRAQTAFQCSLAVMFVGRLTLAGYEETDRRLVCLNIAPPAVKKIDQWRVDEHDVYDKRKTHEKDR